MKKSLPDIYENWLCPVCSDITKDFNHIWSCICYVNILRKILRDSQLYFVTLVNRNIKNDYNYISLINVLLIDDLWDFSQDNFYLTFIDFIKGFILSALSIYLKSILQNKKIVYEIICELHNFIYNEIMNNI